MNRNTGNVGMMSDNVTGIPWKCEEYEVTSWLGGYVRHGQKEQVTTAIIAACRKARSPYPICGAVPNVTGQRQTTCHDFPDVEPDDPEPTILDDVEPMIGNTGCQSVGIDRHFWYTMGGDEYRARSRFGIGLRNSSRRKSEGPIEYAACCAMLYDPRPNVTGPRQTTCHDFPDVEPDDPETPVLDDVKLLGTQIGNRMRRNQIGMFDCESIGCDWDARSNVTGQRQTKCHDFPDVEPDDPETPVLDDVETPGDVETPVGTVDCADSPRQETVPYLVWGAMKENTVISDMVRELQPHDRDDIRQDLALKYWRKAVRQELRGDRIQGLTRWLMADVRQWIGERTDIATSEPLTKQQIDDAKGDTLLLQRSASEESRLEKLEHDLRIVQSQFAAEIEAKRRQSKPRAILALKW